MRYKTLFGGMLLGAVHLVHAQDTNFADDFSVDSISYRSFDFDTSVGVSQTSGVSGAIQIFLEGPTGGSTNSVVLLLSLIHI